MTTAQEFQLINARIAFWQAFEPEVKCELTSTALLTDAGLILIDPIALFEDARCELVDAAPPIAIVLTNANHARAAEDFRRRFSIPILAHSDAVADLEVSVDREIAEGDQIVPGLDVVRIEGAPAGEIALYFEAARAWVLGDALIHLEPLGFSFLPDKYCANAREMKRSLGKLLRFDFDLMTFAHGLPLVTRARPTLESLLA